nr:Glycoside hydrolase and Glycosyl hydrolases 38 domain containing protein [Haemonchus contortus]
MRSLRNIFSVGIICVFTVVCLYLYQSLDNRVPRESPAQEQRISALKVDIERLRGVLKNNHEEIAGLKQQIAEFERKRKQDWDKQVEKENEVYDEKAQAEKALKEKVVQIGGDANHKAVEEEQKGVIPEPNRGNKVAVVFEELHKSVTKSSLPICQMRGNYSDSHADVQMLDLYDVISFDNPDGGVWKQGWEVTYDKEKVTEEKTLQVIVLPHSHCDPGWIKTFEEYYHTQTRNILDGMARHLGLDKDMRFIYAEISFFEMWWKEQNDDVRKKVIQLLKDGIFELVTGGWVMTDEANAHYFSVITELFEGHEWIRNHIGQDFTPTNHWSIDPFGLSPSIPYLLSAANITNAAIQRVHYSVKKHLAKNKQLEFMWRQLWGSHGKPDIRTHMFPFYSYDVPHTCGPDPKICCQFDFRRLSVYNCPWGIAPKKITSDNVEERAFLIYDQYRKKSQLYKTNVLLVPLGDDFRYEEDSEWNDQYDNYQKLFEEMNKRKEWNVHARFGTLSDYFVELDRSLRAEQQSLPVLSGDFFTYSDRDDHYWSGYFTSRPYHKQLDRTLLHQLRAAEIAYSLRSMKEGKLSDQTFGSLVKARRALSLFQHHDGVTGTAKDHVMRDYAEKMLSALQDTEKVLSEALGGLIAAKPVSSTGLLLDEYRVNQDTLPIRRTYKIGEFVVLFNSLSRSRNEPVCIHVDSKRAALENAEGKEVQYQLSPLFALQDAHLLPTGKYELCFANQIKPFGVKVYKVIEKTGNIEDFLAIIMGMSNPQINYLFNGFKFETITGNSFTLKNELLEAIFSANSGFLQSVTPHGHQKVDVDLYYVHYSVRSHKNLGNGGGDNQSGAYLFLPDGEAKVLEQDIKEIMVVKGPIMKKVYLLGPKELEILQVYSLAQNSPSIEITNEVDLRSKSNFELAMRMDTNVQSGDDLFTDLNGLQIIRRRRQLDKLPLQAHFYPMPSAAYIEDTSTRLTLHGNQPLAVSSLKPGQLEVILDRRLKQDDGRGLNQGVMDNRRTLSRFRLLVEPLIASDNTNTAQERIGYHSMVGLAQNMELHYPIVKMISTVKPSAEMVSGITSNLPCDVHVVNLRTLAGPTDYNGSGLASPKNEAALILHRSLTDCRSKLKLDSECDQKDSAISPKTLFPSIRSVRETSLTLLYQGKEITQLNMQPQDVTSVKLSW